MAKRQLCIAGSQGLRVCGGQERKHGPLQGACCHSGRISAALAAGVLETMLCGAGGWCC